MSTKKKNINNNNGNKNNDVAGIIYVIISAFFLICLVTPLLSDIGTFVKNITTGLLGYMSYPIALCTLLYGILLLLNKKAKLSGKQIAYVILMAFSAVLVLQTILDADKLNGSFGEYIFSLISISAVGQSVGGVVFGAFVYLFKAVLSIVGAYILYGLLFVLFAGLLMVDVRAKNSAVVRQNNAQPQKREPLPFVKGKNSAQPLKDVSDTTLFVGTIERTNKVSSRSGDFASMYTPMMDSMHRYAQAPTAPQSAESAPVITPEQYEDEQRAIARNKLYGSPEQVRKSYDELLKSNMNVLERTSGRSNYLIDDEPIISTPTTHVAAPKDQHKQILPTVPVPPQKDITGQIVEGPIVNGEELSQTIKDDTRWKAPNEGFVGNNDKVELPPIITGNPIYKKSETFAAEPIINNESKLEQVEDLDLPPIVNGDMFVQKSANASLQQEVAQQAALDFDFNQEDEKEEVEFGFDSLAQEENLEQDEQPQIIVADDLLKYTEEIESKQEQVDATSDNASSELQINQAPIIVGSDNTFIKDPTLEKEIDALDDLYFDVDDTDEQADEPDSYMSSQAAKATDGELDLKKSNSFVQEDPNTQQEPVYNIDAESMPFAEAKIPDSLKLIDEEVDMTQKREEINDDNTGYYVREGFNKNVGEISLKLSEYKMGLKKGGGVNNQINMDDYDVVVPESAKPKKKKKHLRYNPPPFDLLISRPVPLDDDDDSEEKANILEESLHDLKIGAKVINITKGPAVTRYELEMPLGQSVSKITGRGDDIAYALASDGKIRIEAPIRGKRAVGVEVPNKNIAIVSLREIIESKEFNEAKSSLTLALGKGITGNIMTCNLEKMPHLLIAGTTGSGKSACLNSIIISILYKASPDDVRLILVDPKQVEFVLYRDMPHLLMKNIIKDSIQACNAFKWAREEMDKRYALFAQYSARNLAEYNECEAVKSGLEPKMPRIVIVVDELSELMLAKNSKELEQNIMSLAQKARAAGVHLILATQRPSVDVLTGTIKANFPSRIAFAVKSIPDSRTILDQIGAESLLGRGDMLYAPIDSNDPIRVQGAFVDTEEIESVVNYVRTNNEADYDEVAENIIMKKPEEEILSVAEEDKNGEASEDPLMKDVLRRVIETKTASASQIQRRFSVGYNRASRILDQMEEKGYVGPMDGSKPREVFITGDKFREIYGEDL